MGWAGAAAQFYSRRFLRLTPAFAVAIALTAALGVANMRHDWWVHALYLTNFKVAIEQEWNGASHFWTLAVEEQFYLLWFVLVVIAPRKALLPLMIACLVIGPLYRALVPAQGVQYFATLLPGQIDSLGLGALLAYAWKRPALAPIDRFFESRAVLWGAIFGLALTVSPLGRAHAKVYWVLAPMMMNLAAGCAVRRGVRPSDPGLNWLSAKPMRHVGRISYGLYVYHYLLPIAGYALIPALGQVDGAFGKILRVIAWVLASFFMAEISWAVVEKPALRLKAGTFAAPTPATLSDDARPA